MQPTQTLAQATYVPVRPPATQSTLAQLWPKIREIDDADVGGGGEGGRDEGGGVVNETRKIARRAALTFQNTRV